MSTLCGRWGRTPATAHGATTLGRKETPGARRSRGEGPTQALPHALQGALSEELRGQGLLYRFPRYPRAAPGLARLLRAPPALRAAGRAAHPLGYGAGHAGRNGVHALGDVRALCAYGAGLEGTQALPRQRRVARLARGLYGPGR